MPNAVPLFQVDAYTDTPFRGNPAAVCLLDGPRDERWMQSVAAEMNLAETAFLWPEGDAHRLRWFTPTVEVPLCGHATLASAHVLYETARAKPDATLAFDTHSGRLLAAREGDWLRLDFPALPSQQGAPPAGVIEALGVVPARTARVPRGADDPNWIVEVASAAEVREAKPRFAGLLAPGVHGVILTAASDERACDFVSRFFVPSAGIDEDPVTGSAHCALTPYWCARFGRSELTGHQVSKRGGVVRVRLRGERVDLLGRAVTVLRGELCA